MEDPDEITDLLNYKNFKSDNTGTNHIPDIGFVKPMVDHIKGKTRDLPFGLSQLVRAPEGEETHPTIPRRGRPENS